MSGESAHICEIFSSIQGEGIYVGERQVFVRFAGCNLECSYCDTPQALITPPVYKVEKTPGIHDFESSPNPVSLKELSQIISALTKLKNAVHSVCLTGGEPLLQVDFLKNLMPELKKEQLKIYLETNGTLPRHLNEVVSFADIISMDIKIPSAAGVAFYSKEHKEFLETACSKEVFVKAVVVPETNIREIDEAASLVAEVDREIPFIIQPATPSRKIKHWPKMQTLLAWQAAAKRHLKIVRVIPQVHKILGVL